MSLYGGVDVSLYTDIDVDIVRRMERWMDRWGKDERDLTEVESCCIKYFRMKDMLIFAEIRIILN